MAKFQKEESDREYLRDELNFMDAQVKSHSTTPLTRAQVELYSTQIEETMKHLTINHSNMRHTVPAGKDFDPFVQDYYKLREQSSRLFSSLHGIAHSLPAAANAAATSTQQSTQQSRQHIKLPPLELPKFGGNLQEWVSFRDLFTNAVDKSTLSKVEKLTQLKALLTGEAARQVRSLVLSEDNYDIAWAALKERYENNRELLFSILRRLNNQPTLTQSSATNLRSLIDTTKECVRSLEVLQIPVQHWDAALIFILFSKVDNATRELWEQSLPDTTIPSLSKMYEFLEQRARALAVSTATTSGKSTHRNPPPTNVKTYHTAPAACKLGCTDSHPLFRCSGFNNKTIQQRLDLIKRYNLCRNCLGEGHGAANCRSQRTCKTCNRRHHTMLHLDATTSSTPPQTQQQGADTQPQANSVNYHVQPVGRLQTGILATARILIETPNGNVPARSFLDNGSTNSHITEKTARSLNLPLHPCNIEMTGLEESPVGIAKYVTYFNIKPYFNSPLVFQVTALVVNKISGDIPSRRIRRQSMHHLKDLQLADPDFHVPAPVDILIGSDLFWNVLENGKIMGDAGQPIAFKSSLGWLVGGQNVNAASIRVFNTNSKLDGLLQRFWEHETIQEENQLTGDEEACEKHFQDTHKRDNNGRFTVSLPFLQPRKQLGLSRSSAVRRFLSLEKQFLHPNKHEQWNQYKAFMKEYLDMGHMELIPQTDLVSNSEAYYIPHHCVVKESSTTTKLRVVFDASAKTTNGISLNECLFVGPQLQDSLLDIMLRFRMHPIAFTADIAKMYRQIRIDSNDTKFQRILWRDHPSQPIQEYRLLTVTYGTTSAPYLAIKCLRQLAVDEAERYPKGAEVALSSFYVDDVAGGSDNLEEAKTTVKELINLCDAGGFPLRKWTTNSIELLSTIPPQLRETESQVELQHDNTVKTLGIFWNTRSDKYFYKLNLPSEPVGVYTKRIILSTIAKIFDPLGLLAPIIITCKIFMQSLWQCEAGWDTVLEDSLQQKWVQIRNSLDDIQHIQIPRCVVPIPHSSIYLIGCSDASIKAISAVVYILTETNGNVSCQLLTSKTRVAPVRHVTLPRLELNGAVLLSELLMSTIKSLKFNFSGIRAFVDSTISLHWINSNPSRWKPYIRRRVQAIKDNVPECNWYHIAGETNPADCASRGITAAELLQHPLWWNGAPDVFKAPSTAIITEVDESLLESEAQIRSHHTQLLTLPPLLSSYTSYRKLQRVVSYILRFIRNWGAKKRQQPLQLGTLTVQELKLSNLLILRHLQSHAFPAEVDALRNSRDLPTSSKLLCLRPFLCKDGLLRVGGRLRHARISFEKKYPVLLPKRSSITESIIRDIHQHNFHSGPSATLSFLQQQFWLVNGRDMVRFVLKKCITCTRYKAETMQQLMGDLPADRVNPARPFLKSGVDYAGPFLIKPMVRSKVTLKCWIAIFICLCTKAIHVELVSSLSTDCFIAALRRFVSRRGVPSDIYSDCGTNFKGASKVLIEFFQLCREDAVQDEVARQQIVWHFNPAGGPHFGGLWEAGVKSIKYHLLRVTGQSRLTYEEFQTLIIQIEGILNSRPLVPASSDPSDLAALTPAHFLIGGPTNSIPEPDLSEVKENHLKRWQLLQQKQQLFWKRWSAEYISRLQQRPKWLKTTQQLEPGNMVLIKEERLPPQMWKLGRILEVHPGKDGLVRVATLKTQDGIIKRPIVKLCLLPISNVSSQTTEQNINP